MSTLSERLLEILEREQGGPVVKKITTSIPLEGEPRYEIGTVFVRAGSSINADNHTGILVRTARGECKLICLPSANRWTDENAFLVPDGRLGPTIREFHSVFGGMWIVSKRGTESLAEWSRTDV